MGKVGSNSYTFHHVYLADCRSVVGPKEFSGPFAGKFDKHYQTLIDKNLDSYEKTEIAMIKDAINILKDKNYLNDFDIMALIGGDLNNQIAVSNYSAREYKIPFIGVFGACSTCTLSFFIAANMLEGCLGNIITFTSSHNGTAERQFRYPTEYGTQRADTFTSTVTGAGAFLLTSSNLENKKIKITKATLGNVIDAKIKDTQDMGRAMAPAAYFTIKKHLQDFNINIFDYDLICTGDLSYYGAEMLKELFKEDNIDISSIYEDAGLMIYDRETQNVMAGGSGCGCIAIYLCAEIIPKLLEKKYKKVLICATGALMNPIMLAQKETIPSIAHAITLEVVE